MLNVVLFRAQPFHLGHLSMIKQATKDALKENAEVLVLVGSADKENTKRNPFSIDLRLQLIYRSLLQDEFLSKYVNIIHIRSLVDLTDEADNSYSWGQYLINDIRAFQKLQDYKEDDNVITFYYADKPEIILSWFSNDMRKFIKFKFLERVSMSSVENVSATQVRKFLLKQNYDKLKESVPNYVFERREILFQILKKIY